MKHLLKAGWLSVLLLLYALYRRDRRKTHAIAQMNHALDKAGDHIFALTIEVGHLEERVQELAEDYVHMMFETEDNSEFVRQMMVLHASGYYQQVLFNPDTIVITNNLVNTHPHSERN
jgi:hypothetical protein